MSETFSLVCHETKKRIWIGQGWGKMSSFYTGEPDVMARLHQFLNAHIGKPLVLVCNDRNDYVNEYDDFELTPENAEDAED